MTGSSFLHIGYKSFSKSPGGLERYVNSLAIVSASQGHRVEVCEVDSPHQTENGLCFTSLGSGKRSIPHQLLRLGGRFRQRQIQRPDAINFHFPLYALPLLPQLPKGVPLTYTFHGPWALESQFDGQSRLAGSLKMWIEMRIHRRMDRFIVLSNAFGTILQEEYGIEESRIHQIPGGVNTKQVLFHSMEIMRQGPY